MRSILILAAGLLIASVAPGAHAQTFVASAGTGCQVSVDAVPGDTTYCWQGEFKDGVSMQDSLDFPDAQGRASPISSTPVAGEWTFTSDDGKCVEHHTYNADGSAEIKGGEEVMQSAYGLMQVTGNQQVFGLVRTSVASNGKKDCSGRVTPVERDDTRFIYL